MGFSKADIKRAREHNALKIAQGQLGKHIKSLDQVEIVKRINKSDANLGKVLKKQIKAEKFAQTKGGKVFNAIGDFGMGVVKKIATPPKKKKKTPVRVSVEEVMKRLPQ